MKNPPEQRTILADLAQRKSATLCVSVLSSRHGHQFAAPANDAVATRLSVPGRGTMGKI